MSPWTRPCSSLDKFLPMKYRVELKGLYLSELSESSCSHNVHSGQVAKFYLPPDRPLSMRKNYHTHRDPLIITPPMSQFDDNASARNLQLLGFIPATVTNIGRGSLSHIASYHPTSTQWPPCTFFEASSLLCVNARTLCTFTFICSTDPGASQEAAKGFMHSAKECRF